MAFRKSSDFSYKESTDVVSADLSHVGLITQRKFKNSGLDRLEHFTSLETMKNNNSNTMVVTATPRANLASLFFGELSQIGSNFGESDDSMDSPTSMNLEVFTPGESSHVPTCPPSFDQRNKDVEESLTKSKFRNEKLSASVAALSIQQLQDMITNTIRAQYGGTPQSSLYYSKPYTRRITCLSMSTNYQPSKLQQFNGKGNLRQYIAHFVETCSNARTYDDLLVKQFVRLLKGNAFDWYIDLRNESIDS
ncbi:hypothetical protein R3W88_034199 [Solanum pinnatisectum]|uniref:Ty3-gypsy retrotransposon protein n=1 Tax=Solanum pinnatisectum TaxID=50273 RepID=A0AAV9JZC2_9SOLN|nr:hypothetical protein R3W88_034199 [Solanum pinnatisectum]